MLNKTQFLLKLITCLAESKKPVAFMVGNITDNEAAECEVIFKGAKEWLVSHGFHVINPCDFMDMDGHWLAVRRNCIQLLVQAEYIAMLKNWNLCKEARLMHELASQLGINAIYQ